MSAINNHDKVTALCYYTTADFFLIYTLHKNIEATSLAAAANNRFDDREAKGSVTFYVENSRTKSVVNKDSNLLEISYTFFFCDVCRSFCPLDSAIDHPISVVLF